MTIFVSRLLFTVNIRDTIIFMWKGFVIGALLLQGANAQPAKEKAQAQQQSPAPSVSPAALDKRQVETGDKTNGASNGQQSKQDDEAKAFQRTQTNQYWFLVAAAGIQTVLFIAYTIFAGLQWRSISRQASDAHEQLRAIKKQSRTMLGTWQVMRRQAEAMEKQLAAINDQEKHLSDQVAAAKDAAEQAKGQLVALQSQERAMHAQSETMRRQLVVGSRAYVGVSDISMEIARQSVFLYMSNVGKAPATNIQLICELTIQIPWRFMPEQEPSALQKALGAPVNPESWRLQVPFMRHYGERTKLFPGLSLEAMIPLSLDNEIEPGGYLTDRELPLIVQGHAEVFIKGQISYFDGFTPDRVTDFAYRYHRLKDRDFWAAHRIDKPWGDEGKPDNEYGPE